MPKRIKKPPVDSHSHWDSEVRLLAWLALCISILSFLYYFQRGDVMLYGDAVAHANIARRVFDSKTPGLLQLGTVWLPLPHLLMIPFLISKEMWQRGVGGSIPSMIAYVLGAVGIFRLVRGALARGGESDAPAHVAAWVAAMVYAANPNLIYMQTTAMGESLYLALFIWAMVYFSEFWQGEHAALMKCGLCLMAACLTRYDGWVLAAAMAAAVIVRSSMGWEEIGRGALIRFVLLVAAGPALWLAYNGMVYGNPLEFENGPYSAKAIEQRTQGAGNPGHPGTGNPVVAGLYFVKAAEENVAANHWLQRAWILLAVAGMAWGGYLRWPKVSNKIAASRANHAREMEHPILLVWLLIVPVLFYALSVAYGGVPIFVPSWWPFTHYNVRYGLQMLPGFAAAIGVVVWFVVRSGVLHWRTRLGAVLALVAFVGVSYASVWRAGPICLSEAEINMRSRNQLEAQVASWLGKLPQDSTLLMYLGDHVGALQRAGIPLKQVINEGNHRVWKRPADPDGLWERALADPSRYADYVVAFEGGPVWQAVHGMHLPEIVEIHVSGQAAAIICRAR